MAAGREVTGRRLCGAVRYRAALKNRDIGACHCSICRRWSGGLLLAVEAAGVVDFQDAEQIGTYRASVWGERGSSRECGTNQFWRLQDGSHVVLCAGTLDDDASLMLTSEFFIDEKPDYYEFANEISKLTGQQVFELFGAEQEKG